MSPCKLAGLFLALLLIAHVNWVHYLVWKLHRQVEELEEASDDDE